MSEMMDVLVNGSDCAQGRLSPVQGWRGGLGLTAEHHLPVFLHVFHGVYDAAGLLGEDRTLQDPDLC